jgi:hypothetical protein
MLLGRFAGVDELHASPWSPEEIAPVDVTSTSELGGSLLVMRVTERRRAGVFEAVNIFMSDRDTGELLLYGFDSLGYAPEPPSRGAYEDERVALYRASPRGESRTEFAATCSGFRWAKYFRASSSSGWQPVVTGTLRRVPSIVGTEAAG